MRVTEEGFESTEVIPGNLTPEKLNEEEINKIKERILNWWPCRQYRIK